MSKRILIIAGEVSGDHHGADLVAAIRARDSEVSFHGIGGDAMQKAGVTLQYHISQMAFLGISEVVRHLPFIRKVRRGMEREMDRGVDAVLLVDYPGFNLMLASSATKRNIPVIFYISPQLWAWREGRVEKIRRRVDMLMVIFKFEEAFYRRHGIRANFTGHPLVDQIHPEPDDKAFRLQHQLAAKLPVIGLFPGSREMEVRKLLPVMLQSLIHLAPGQALLPIVGAAPGLPESLYEELMKDYPEVRRITGESHRLMQHSYAALVASGTATLELGYLQTPMVVLYTVSRLTYELGKRLVKVSNIALANIVLGDTVVPELIQYDMTAQNAARELNRYLQEEPYYRQVRQGLGGVRAALGEAGASERAADLVVRFLAGERELGTAG